MTEHMTAAEAERRVDSVFNCGGTPEQKRFALKRWTEAMSREWYAQPKPSKKAAAKALSGK